MSDNEKTPFLREITKKTTYTLLQYNSGPFNIKNVSHKIELFQDQSL